MDVSTTARAVDLRHSDERFKLLVQSVRDYAIFMLDPDGNVLTWNAGARRFKGYRADEIIGRHFSVFYPPEALASDFPQHELDVARRTGSFEDEGWRVKKDGSRFWANVVITAMHSPSGELVGFAKVTRDLTERRNHEEALRRSEERFRLLVEGVVDYAIFMLDVNGHIASWNSGAERMKGYSADEIIGRHFSIFYPEATKASGWPEHELAMAAQEGRFVDEGWRLKKDGTSFWANVTITALKDDTGRLLGYAKLTRDLTERKRSEAAERTSKQRDEILEAERNARMAAQRATQIKDEFLATLSHELRTPLSAVLGWTQVIMRTGDSMPPEAIKRAVEVIDRNARAQVELINDLLDLSRIMTGKIRLDIQHLSFADIVQAALDSAMPTATAKGVQLELAPFTGPAMIRADGGRIQQVVWNLLTNAIKFTPKGGQILLTLEQSGQSIQLTVTDSGVGIPAAFLPHVFDRFAQRESATTRSYGGLGLGLAISKQLVELHSGAIRASSAGEGMGASFFVQLPLAGIQSTSEQPQPGSTAYPALGAESALPSLEGVHVFVVDDEPDGRDLIQRVLREQGAEVTCFDSAEEALASLQQIKPAVIVSDVGMPRVDGYQFMRSLRAMESRADWTPAVALTAFARPEDRKKALLAGYQAHLAKPFDLAELILVVAGLAGK